MRSARWKALKAKDGLEKLLQSFREDLSTNILYKFSFEKVFDFYEIENNFSDWKQVSLMLCR